MTIRSTEQFEREAIRGIMHKKSSELKNVINKLRLYHADRAVSLFLRAHLLIDLRDSVTVWGENNPREFRARHGPELEHEIRVALVSSDAEHLKLVNGDILFRWVPFGIDQRRTVQAIIAFAQSLQADRHLKVGLEGTAVDHSNICVQHVGIYADDKVIEIGPGGLLRSSVINRPHYDLVVRSRKHGQRIANSARLAQAMGTQYPVWDLAIAAWFTLPGTPLLGPESNFLRKSNFDYRQKQKDNFLQQNVVCSHFVNAVLYAAVDPEGTLATATDHDYDEIFKVSPSQMWFEFLHRRGLWADTHAVFVGLQHKGNLDRNIDPRKLGVGLKQPPVPKRAGRPPPLAPPLPR